MSAGPAQLHAAIATFDGQCALLGDTMVDMALAPMRAKLAALGEAVRRTGLPRAVGRKCWQRSDTDLPATRSQPDGCLPRTN